MPCPKITVIVPVYNKEKTLRRTLDSLLIQNYRDYEVIMVNDGSSDGSGRICDEYAAVHVNFRAIHKSNSGVSSARNQGLDYANGEWITFCDADDCVSPDWLNIFVENCAETDLVVQGFITDKSNTMKGVDYVGDVKGGFLLMAQQFIVGYIWVKLFRRDIMRKYNIQFNENFAFREDEEFVLKYLNVINHMTCIKNGAYIYNMPDLKKKYSDTDNFYCSCSLFRSVRQLLGDSFEKYSKAYLDELTEALFYSFAMKKKDRRRRLEVYQQTVRRYVIYSRISVFSKLMLLLVHNSNLVCWIFAFKKKANVLLQAYSDCQ